MNVVIADVEQQALEAAVSSVQAGRGGGGVLGERTDVADAVQVAQLAERAVSAFGKVHLLCANAGVATYGSLWQQSMHDWEWTMGVNLWGVVNSLRAFLPAMIAHGEPGRAIITSSSGGLKANSSSAYGASKYAVLGIAEGLRIDLAATQIRASVICPGGVKSRIFQSERNRPAEWSEKGPLSPEFQRRLDALASPTRTDQFPPSFIADLVMNAIRDDQFYILPMQPHHKEPILKHFRELVQALEQAPTAI